MRDPVVAADNKCYERESIEHWIIEAKQGLDEASQNLLHCKDHAAREKFDHILATGVKAPATGTPLAHLDLFSNDSLRDEIAAYRRAFQRNEVEPVRR